MAEGFARNLGTESFEVVSAGLESSNVNPTAVDVMREAGVDIYAQLPNLFLDSNQPTSFSLWLRAQSPGSLDIEANILKTGLSTMRTANQSKNFERPATRSNSTS
jgi:hypothetical protein